MRLAAFVDQVFWFDGEYYSTDTAFINFILSFEQYFEKITLYARVSPEIKTDRYRITSPKVEVRPFPFYKDLYSLWKTAPWSIPKIYSILAQDASTWDIVWLCIPHPFDPLFIYLCKRHNKPFFMLVRQNLVELVRRRSPGIQRTVAVFITELLERRAQKLASKHVTFAVGNEMYKIYKKQDIYPVYEVACTLISKDNVISSADQKKYLGCNSSVDILCVSRLDPEKGIQYLIDAIHILVHRYNHNVVLNLVGRGRLELELKEQVKQLDLDKHVVFKGYITHGEELLNLFKSSSCFILPSLWEGLPQVLLEAMACGTPIIATDVGGIPNLLQNEKNGLLVKSADPDEIAKSVLKLITNESLYNEVIKNGLNTVLDYTLEVQRERMLNILREHNIYKN